MKKKKISKKEWADLLKESEKVILPLEVREAFDTIDRFTRQQEEELKKIKCELK